MEIVSSSSPTLNPSGAYLAWEDLTAVLPNYGSNRPSKKLLNGLSGYAAPGRALAIMGPSGSGKSTLLDSLAGRLGNNVVLSGNVLLNGKKRSLDYGVVAYVTQEDVLLGTLTVREYLRYSAQLRFPPTTRKHQLIATVEATIDEMGLQDCSDTLIGNWHLRGISGGEKKRLSIALELLTQPPLLFLDEPTSGLDSAAAFFLVLTLRQMAHEGNKTIVSSIHQPSSEVFALFDDLFLLSGGETVYFGDAKTANSFFAEAGFPCPSRRNPSDHFLRCINSDFDQVNATLRGSMKISMAIEPSSDPLSKLNTSEIKHLLIEKYKTSSYAMIARKQLREIRNIEGAIMETDKGSQARWLKQLTTLTRRSFVNMSRDIGYYWLRVVIYIVVSVSVGSLYYDVGTGYTAIMARAACGAFISGFLTFMSIGGFPSFIEELKVFDRERQNGYYGAAVYTISNYLSSLPYLILVSTTSGAIVSSMVKYHKGFIFNHFVFFIINLYGGVAVIESLMMIIAALVPNYMMGLITGAGVIGLMMMTAGFFRLLPDLPKVIWRYPISYISYGSWGLQAALKDEFLGQEFDPMIPGDPKISGEYVVQHIFGISLERSKWFDVSMIFVLLVSYRLIFFLLLKFKEKIGPLIRTFYKRTTSQKIVKMPSIKTRTPSFSSRAMPMHPLSVQEGLSSPLA